MSWRRFLWLLGDGTGPEAPNRPEFLLACVFAGGCFPVLAHIAPRLLAWGAAHAQTAEAQLLRDGALAAEIHTELQLRLTRRLLSEVDVPVVLLKGGAVRHLAWPDPLHRGAWDIDLGAEPEHGHRVEQTARAQGFAPCHIENGVFLPIDPLTRALQEVGHYERVMLVREQEVVDLEPEEQAAIRRSLPLFGGRIWHIADDGALIARTGVDIHHALLDGHPMTDALASSRTLAGWPVPSLAIAAQHLWLKLDHELDEGGIHVLHLLADLLRVEARLHTDGLLTDARRLVLLSGVGSARVRHIAGLLSDCRGGTAPGRPDGPDS